MNLIQTRVEALPNIVIGRTSENLVQVIEIDLSAWLEDFPDLSDFSVLIKNADGVTYPGSTSMQGSTLIWSILASDTQVSGVGFYEVLATSPGGARKLSHPARCTVLPALSALTQQTPPAAAEGYVTKVLAAAKSAEASAEAAKTAQEAAENAQAHPPIIGDAGTWLIWDDSAAAYKDTNLPAQGPEGPEGPQGEPGNPGVHVGAEAPTDEETEVWVIPNGTPWQMPTASAEVKGGAKVGEGLTVDADEKLRIKQEVLDRIDQNETDIDSLSQDCTGSRITSLDNTQLAGFKTFESVGIPVYVSNVSDYSAYAITETGWYLFIRIAAMTGVVVTAETTITGAAGYIASLGAAYVDVAVRFDVAAQSQTVTVTWTAGNAERFVFKATDLAVRNLDYRTTFYVYDIAPFAAWSYTAATDTTAVGTAYYTLADGVYTQAAVKAYEEIPADTYYTLVSGVYKLTTDPTFVGTAYYTLADGVYTQAAVKAGAAISGLYVHSGVTFEGMARNVTYKCDTVIDCPTTFVLPEIEDDTHGCWYEIRFRHAGSYSNTLQVPDGVKVATEQTQSATAGINMVDLHYTDVGGVKSWRFMNTHSSIPV